MKTYRYKNRTCPKKPQPANSFTPSTSSKAAGIGEDTLYRWLKDDGFNAAYRDARRHVVQQGIVKIQRACRQRLPRCPR
jgi:hypothetical protein